MRRFRQLLIALLAIGQFLPQQVHAIESNLKQIVIKNCVDNKSGKARFVSAETRKCKKNERIVRIALPKSFFEIGSSILSGESPPIDYQDGKDGDFFFDRSATKLYGPRTKGLWGDGFCINGESCKLGSTILSGFHLPLYNEGKKGDFYLDLNTYYFYGPKESDTKWPQLGVPLIGRSGSKGDPGATGAQGPKGETGATGLTTLGSNGSFYDTTIFSLSLAAQPIPFSNTAISNGVSLVDGSKIRLANSGIYNISFSSQLFVTDSSTKNGIVNFWLAKNGVAEPWSNTKLFITKGVHAVAAWNFLVSASANDYFQLFINTEADAAQILTVPASGSIPAVPGTILTVNQVG